MIWMLPILAVYFAGLLLTLRWGGKVRDRQRNR